ncbi:MAG: LuxR C-terminal-related transcriptional regulator [Oscillospiraceae bacterium]|nr:LuxR C-terminal-related transcriptional regulator [Oscillospiraceae bacterium]
MALHVQIQAAAALTQLGKLDDARVALTSALDLALPDGLLLPFAENHGYLAPLLAAPWPAPYREFLQRVAQLDAVHAARCAALRSADERPAALAALTEREAAIAALIAARCTNREIAAQLCLSEGSVKQYVNQIYAKLQIGGDTRTKRQRLAALQKN